MAKINILSSCNNGRTKVDAPVKLLKKCLLDSKRFMPFRPNWRFLWHLYDTYIDIKYLVKITMSSKPSITLLRSFKDVYLLMDVVIKYRTKYKMTN